MAPSMINTEAFSALGPMALERGQVQEPSLELGSGVVSEVRAKEGRHMGSCLPRPYIFLPLCQSPKPRSQSLLPIHVGAL